VTAIKWGRADTARSLDDPLQVVVVNGMVDAIALVGGRAAGARHGDVAQRGRVKAVGRHRAGAG